MHDLNEVLEQYKNKLIQLKYSPITISNYCKYFRDFRNTFEKFDLLNVKPEKIDKYILYLAKKDDISISQQNQRINAIKFYYVMILGKERQYSIINRPVEENKPPQFFSKDEVKRILESCNNIKHRSILALLYSAGLRRAELINLNIADIDSDNMVVKVKGGKGNKDRDSLLSEYTLQLLRKYYKSYKPKVYLFEGAKGNRYSASSIENIVKKSAKKAGITKNATPHMFRHSFATHLLEQGKDSRYIQELLGHTSANTTQIYTHVTNNAISRISNPIDELFEED